MNVLSLFSGIGAFDLGLERAGMTIVAFCESDAYCRRVLAKHWPEVPQYGDVRSLTAERLRAAGISVDVIAGGWPCQPHSVAGARGASADDRDLWPDFARLIREIRPRWVVAENVPGLRSSEFGRFFGGILRDLAGAGYDAEWRSISAADMGAPHRRERVWIVAYPAQQRERSGRYQPAEDAGRGQFMAGAEAWRDADHDGEAVADAIGVRQPQQGGCLGDIGRWSGDGGEPVAMADAGWVASARHRSDFWPVGERDWRITQSILGQVAPRPACGMDGSWGAGWEDGTPRVARGIPNRVQRLRALGNALVPQIPEMIGRAIMAVAA